MKEILIHNGSYTLVDDDVYDKYKEYNFYCNQKGHVYRNMTQDGWTKTSYLHREIMNVPKGMIVDHIDRNPLNNQRSNLRVVTHAQNLQNSGKPKGEHTSKYKGVSWNPVARGWRATVRYNKRIDLGLFSTEEAAANAYNDYVRKHGDNYAHINDVHEDHNWEEKRIPNRREGVGTSKYIGVSWSRGMKKWQCHIMVNYKSIGLGYFEDEKEAAVAYNEAAIKYRGNKAKLNLF